MPIYTMECQETECAHSWEDLYGQREELPTTCPKCNKETLKRVMSLQSRGQVELSGSELDSKIKSDVRELKQKMRTNENTFANIVGESKVQSYVK